MVPVEYIGVGASADVLVASSRDLTYGDPPVRQHRLEANAGEARANENADYHVAAYGRSRQ